MNWFEGGRRITRLLQGLVVVGAMGVAVFTNPYVPLTFETSLPNDSWRIAGRECDSINDAEVPSPIDLGVGETLTRLCFRAVKADDGRMLVPYKVTGPSRWYGSTPNSSEVDAYVVRRSSEFNPPTEVRAIVREHVSKEWWKAWRKSFIDSLVFAVVGIVLLYVLSWVIGWIVRGFAGVPAGHDFKPGLARSDPE